MLIWKAEFVAGKGSKKRLAQWSVIFAKRLSKHSNGGIELRKTAAVPGTEQSPFTLWSRPHIIASGSTTVSSTLRTALQLYMHRRLHAYTLHMHLETCVRV